MCGRFVSASPPDEIARYFDAVDPGEAVLAPSYNVAPTDDVYGVLEHDGERVVETFHWGLVPNWAKSAAVGSRMINARAETVAAKFKPSFMKRRCIVPATGFYEWRTVPGQKKKQPMFIHDPSGAPLAMAGLWETWRDREVADLAGAAHANAPRGDLLHSCTIITTTANDDLAPIHDRMPVLLPRDVWATWLDESNDDLDALAHLLVPAPTGFVELYPVGAEVGNVANQGAHLLARVVPDVAAQGTLL